MNKIMQVLLADESPEYCTLTSQLLNDNPDISVVACVHTGDDLLAQACKLQPDMLILDAILPGMDPLEALEKLLPHYGSKRPFIYIASNFCTEGLANQLALLGVNYITNKPVRHHALAEAVRYFSQAPLPLCPLPSSPMHLAADHPHYWELQVGHALQEMGVPTNIDGHNYLKDSTLLMLENREAAKGITKVLYPTVAKLHSTKASCVERAIRTAIEILWSRGNRSTMTYYLGHRMAHQTRKPTNSQFISMLAEQLRDKTKIG